MRLPRIGWTLCTGKWDGFREESGESMIRKTARVFMVLSRGLGSAEGVPRFNNPPELVVLDLLPES